MGYPFLTNMNAVAADEMLPDNIRTIPLINAVGESQPLGALIEDRLSVLVFLRHFGCIACQEHVGLWKPHLSEFAQADAQVLFVGNGKPDSLAKFINKTGLNHLPAEAYTEPTQALHRALGLVNSVASTLSPGAVFNALRAVSRGNFQTSVEGDPLQQGGLLLVNAQGRVVLLHRERQLGDYMKVENVLQRVRSL